MDGGDFQDEIYGETAAFDNEGSSSSADHGWKKVSYAKTNRRKNNNAVHTATDLSANGSHVFATVELKAHERLKALEDARNAAEDAAIRSRIAVADGANSDEEHEIGKENGGAMEVKKVKKVKQKKPKITVSEAASKIDSSDLAAFLVEVTTSYEGQPDIQLMRFADYFARAFSLVNVAQFPWTKLIKELPIAKLVDVPICYISEPVYKTAVDWIAQCPVEYLANFVLWSLDNLLEDLALHIAASKPSKKPVQKPSTRAQVAIFVVLAMTLRRKPDVMINILPSLKNNPKYQGQEKLQLITWMISQACQGDLVIGLFTWVRYLLPLVYGKSNPNPQSRDLLLQLVERILSAPKARPILLNGAVRKGERLVTPSALEVLWEATFPVSSSRIKATERFEVIYPTLKEIALAGSLGSKAMKPVAQQLLSASARAASTDNAKLCKEATDIFIWCLTQTTDCFKQWEQIYLDNIDASVAALKKLCDEWKDYSAKLSPVMMRATINNLRVQNEGALADDPEDEDSIKKADKYCKLILGRLNRRSKCLKSMFLLTTLAVAIGGALVYSPEAENWDLAKIYTVFKVPQAF